MFLPCNHSFGVEFLDELFGMHDVYRMSMTGKIEAVAISPTRQAHTRKICCPTCQHPCQSVKRYALLHKLSTFEQDVDRMYAKSSRKLHIFMGDMERMKLELDLSFDTAASELKPGPLTGRKNADVVRARTNASSALEASITGFRGRPTPYIIKRIVDID